MILLIIGVNSNIFVYKFGRMSNEHFEGRINELFGENVVEQKEYSMEKMYLLYHMYDYGEHSEYEEIKTLGIYSSEQEASEAIERYYRLEGFKKFPKECFYIDEYKVDIDANWREGFVNSADLEQDFETLTMCFNEWLGNNKDPHGSWEDQGYYNALCDINEVIYKIKDIKELAEYIQEVWVRRFDDSSKNFDEYLQIAGDVIAKGFYDKYD